MTNRREGSPPAGQEAAAQGEVRQDEWPPDVNPNGASALRTVAIMLARYEIRNLRRLYDEFDQDILLPLLLGEIALHNIGALDGMATTRASADQADQPIQGLICTLKPCNAYSIAAASGLARETVRRKIARLVELGWISRRHNGHLYVSSRAMEHFGNLLTSRDLPELLEMADSVRHQFKKLKSSP